MFQDGYAAAVAWMLLLWEYTVAADEAEDIIIVIILYLCTWRSRHGVHAVGVKRDSGRMACPYRGSVCVPFLGMWRAAMLWYSRRGCCYCRWLLTSEWYARVIGIPPEWVQGST